MQRYLYKCNSRASNIYTSVTHELAMQFTKRECHFLFQNSRNAGHRTVLEKIAVSVRPKWARSYLHTWRQKQTQFPEYFIAFKISFRLSPHSNVFHHCQNPLQYELHCQWKHLRRWRNYNPTFVNIALVENPEWQI